MCTVSFLPKSHGFYLAMNRDEKLDRFGALAPAIIDLGYCRAVFPCEPTGGTWISANDAGVCLALVNWHRVECDSKKNVLSRGIVVRELAGKSRADEIATALMKLPLRNLRPFRLIAIAPAETRVVEWSWNLKQLVTRNHAWQRQHWFSSGFDEGRAELERQRVCDAAHNGQLRGSLTWLRQLHCSHVPKRGPFSICMHRRGASTVSYTEVAMTPAHVVMRYRNGPPCSTRPIVTKKLRCSQAR